MSPFRPLLRSAYRITRNTIQGQISVFWGLRQIKWCLRALVGLSARPTVTNLLGEKLHSAEGVCPVEGHGPARDEQLSLAFRVARRLKLSGTETPVVLGKPEGSKKKHGS